MTMEISAAAESGFSLDSIKQLMDGLDPAALLPEMNHVLNLVRSLCRIAVCIGPLLLLGLGLAYLLLAPKEANWYFGYHTYFGMGSVKAWRFTQRLAGVVLGACGLVLTIAALIVCSSFGSLELMDVVWKAVRCLAWQAGIALLANAAINIAAAVRFDRKGNLRLQR